MLRGLPPPSAAFPNRLISPSLMSWRCEGEECPQSRLWAQLRLGGRVNRSWPEALKREIVASSFAPGSSVSMVARHYDVNTNQVFGWRKRYRNEPRAPAVPSASRSSASSPATPSRRALHHCWRPRRQNAETITSQRCSGRRDQDDSRVISRRHRVSVAQCMRG
jgi:transposase-like protein